MGPIRVRWDDDWNTKGSRRERKRRRRSWEKPRAHETDPTDDDLYEPRYDEDKDLDDELEDEDLDDEEILLDLSLEDEDEVELDPSLDDERPEEGNGMDYDPKEWE